MEPRKQLPPGYTSTDTSNEKALLIPYFSLGPPRQSLEPKTVVRMASFRSKDLSGNYVVKR
jgi:hypothetical protein